MPIRLEVSYSMDSSAILKFIASSDTCYRVKEIVRTYVHSISTEISGLSLSLCLSLIPKIKS